MRDVDEFVGLEEHVLKIRAGLNHPDYVEDGEADLGLVLLMAAEIRVEGDSNGSGCCAKLEGVDERTVRLQELGEWGAGVAEELGEGVRLGVQAWEHLDGLCWRELSL